MSRKLLKFIRIADGKPYADSKKHELRMRRWLIEAGFKKHDIKYQPYGSNNPPDWLVKVDSKWVELECKTSLEAKVSFNDTPPSKNVLYIFSSKRHNDTMVFYGQDVFKRGVKKSFDEYIKKAKALEKKYINECMLSKRLNPYGFVPGFRLRLQQRGGMKVTDFFAPGTRELLVRKAKQRNI